MNIPKYISICIDIFTESSRLNDSKLIEALTILFLLAVGVICVRTLSRVMFFNSARKIENRIKNDLFEILTKLSKSYYDKYPSGVIISYLNNNITGIRLMFGFGTMQVVNMFYSLTLTPYMMYKISPLLTLYVFLPVCVSFIIIKRLLSKLSDNMDMRQKELGELSDFTMSSLSGINEIKTYGIYNWSSKRFLSHNETLFNRSLKISTLRSLINPLLNNLDNVLKLIVLIFGGMSVISKEMTAGDLMAMMVYTWVLSVPLGGMGWVATILQETAVNIRSLMTIFEREIMPDYKIPKQDVSPEKCIKKNGIQIRNMNYQYENSEKNTLNNISFEIPPGTVIGILGGLGSGKSTLIDCLNKYLDISSDMILTDGRDIKSFSYLEWRSAVRTATENPFLFSGTVEENICFGNCDPLSVSEKEWSDIFRRSALTAEIQSFPQGRKTVVGEKGIMLSGGQKQRVSLARAMLKPSALLILDNVLSAVDYETERILIREILQKNISESLMLVSHRTDAMIYADQIIVMEEGKLIEQGTHDELMKISDGYYAKTWEFQHENSKQNTV